jgi:hypothetical protein
MTKPEIDAVRIELFEESEGNSHEGCIMTLRSAYFSDWGGNPTVLLWGDPAGMRDLRDFLRTVQNGPGPFTLGHFCQAVDGKSITVRLISGRRGTGMYLNRQSLEWTLQPESADAFAEKVDVLVSSVGHQYLDGASDSITVTVSTGEYPASLCP